MTLPGFLDRTHVRLFLLLAAVPLVLLLGMPFYAGSCPYVDLLNRGEGSFGCLLQRVAEWVFTPVSLTAQVAFALVYAGTNPFSAFFGNEFLLVLILGGAVVALGLGLLQLWFLSLVLSSAFYCFSVLSGAGSKTLK